MKDECLRPFCFTLMTVADETRSRRRELIEAVRSNEAAFDLQLADDAVGRLADYYELVEQHNPILHLVGPCAAEEFATRHILESLTLLRHLPHGTRFADVGAGAGLPSIPCLLAREDLSALLIESKEKKSRFLASAASNLFASGRVEIINRQFEEVTAPDTQFITCRALDKFVDKLPRLLKWGRGQRMLLFGGDNLREALAKLRVGFDAERMPLSEQRFLFVLR
jgi:16S rRNA (guanine527-N7)-methyltransferase